MKAKTKVILFLIGIVFFAGIMHHSYVKSQEALESMHIADSLRVVVQLSNIRYDSLKVEKLKTDSILINRIGRVNEARASFRATPKLVTPDAVDSYLKQFIEE
jgi:hypothetical protein